MANTIDASLYPLMFAPVKAVPRNLAGFIPSVNYNFSGVTVDIKNAGEDKNYITIPVAGHGDVEDYTPAQEVVVGGNTTDTKIQVQITKNRMRKWHMSADERNALNAAGNDNAKELFRQKMEYAMGQLMDEVENELAGDIYKNVSRSRGQAGVTPFASSLAPLSAAQRVLNENGAPGQDRSFIMGPAASENFMNLNIVQAANVAASDLFLRQGVILDHLGFAVRISNEISEHTAGTATGFDANGGEAIGETEIAVDGSDSGTILAGDTVAFVGDDNEYVVADETQSASGSASGNIIINDPGLKVTLVSAVEGSLGVAYTPAIAMQRNCYALVVRPPAIDATPIIKTKLVQDPRSKLTFMICECLGDGLTTWRVHVAWGLTKVNTEFGMSYKG